MSTNRIRLLVDIDIHDGKFAEFEAIVREMAAASAREPGTIAYHFVLDADRKRCRLIEGYTDQAAIAAHFDGPAVQEWLPKMTQVATPKRLEIYGDPGPKVTAMAAAIGATLYSDWQGFDR